MFDQESNFKDVLTPFELFPFIVGWELTLRCNLCCAHCGSSASRARPDELTTEEALRLCDQFPALLVQEVDFTGGEPLLRPDWAVIAARLAELSIPVNILTNGLEVSAATVAEMKDVGVRAVGISLDGMQGTHDFIRNRKGSFAAVLRTIDLLQQASMPTNVITTVSALNLAELPQLLGLLKLTGANAWRLQPLIPMGRALNEPQMEIGTAGIIDLGKFVREHKSQVGDMRLICSDGLEYVDDDPRERPWQGCSAGIIACGITSDGKVKGCLSMTDDLVEGDLRQRRLWDIWFDSASFTYMRGFELEHLGPNCRDCMKGAECKGGCCSSSHCATNLFHNDPICFYKANRTEQGLTA